jgi:hypothetical protein
MEQELVIGLAFDQRETTAATNFTSVSHLADNKMLRFLGALSWINFFVFLAILIALLGLGEHAVLAGILAALVTSQGIELWHAQESKKLKRPGDKIRTGNR